MSSIDHALHLRGRVYWLKLAIPRAIRSQFLSKSGKPKTHVEESLGTQNIAEARRRRNARIAVWQAAFDRKARGRSGVASPEYAAGSVARFREAMRNAANDASDGDDDGFLTSIIVDSAIDRAKEIEATRGLEAAQHFYRAALDTRTASLVEAFNDWEAANEHTEGTKAKYRVAFRSLLEFLGREGGRPVEDALPSAINRQTAIKYAEWLNKDAMGDRGGTGKARAPLSYASKRDRLRALGSFWKDHLEHNEIVPYDSNPWRGHKVTGKRKPSDEPTGDDEDMRAYTDEELLRILNGPQIGRTGGRFTKRTLVELYSLGLYTGARLNELAGLKLTDVEALPNSNGYVFHVRRSKTKAGKRSVPVLHPLPVQILKERIEDLNRPNGNTQLFAEFRPGGKDRKLGNYASKRMSTYRDRVNLPGDVDFHSTRRNLITLCERLQVHGITIKRYVGHSFADITFGTYSEGSPEALLELARTVKYPQDIEAAIRAALGYQRL